jgi:hypothetical protein
VNLKRFFSPSMAVAGTALFVALGGGSYAAAHAGGPQHHEHYVPAKRVVTSGGVKFLHAGETRRLGKVGHFTFSATCSKVDGDN